MHDSATYTDDATGPFTPAPPRELVIAGHYISGARYRVQRINGTRNWFLTYTRAGGGQYIINGETFRCQEGDVILLSPGTVHDYGTSPDKELWDFYWTHFQPRDYWLDWLSFAESAPGLRKQTIPNPQNSNEIEEAFQRLLRRSQRAGTWQTSLSENALEEIIILIAQEAARSASHLFDTRVATVMQTIRDRYHEPLTVGSLAELVGLSPSRLAHLFKAQTGSALIETIIAFRLRQAARLLEFTDLPISTIASAVGFESSFYFSRQFRHNFGCSPSAYRRRTV